MRDRDRTVVHHRHVNSNFAVIDNSWDRLLGTYRNPDADDAGNSLPESLGGGPGRVKRAVWAFQALPCETELSLMITPGISLNGKQRSGLSSRRALVGIPGSRALPGSCTIARPPACSIATSPFVPSLPPPVSMIPITREPYMLAADRKSGSAAGPRWCSLGPWSRPMKPIGAAVM